MHLKRGRGRVRVLLDDGTEYETQGLVVIGTTKTTARVDYTNGSSKEYPIITDEIKVVVKSVPHEIVEGVNRATQ